MKKMAGTACFCMLFVTLYVLQGCKKQSTNLNLPQLADYYPTQPGKVFIYRLDSTYLDVTYTQLLVDSYLIKDSMGIVYSDNLGRPSYPVYRFITDTLNSTPWQALVTYYITPTAQDVEVVDDNNLRFIKLVEPITDSFTWSGNSYINTQTGTYQYMAGWSYIYRNVNQPYTVLKGTVDSTVTVLQDDNTSPPGPFDPSNAFQERDYSIEVYGKGIGLIYKDFLHWIWQGGVQQYDPYSYGIRLNLISVQ